MKNTPRTPKRATTLGLVALLSVGAVACSNVSADPRTDASGGASPAAVIDDGAMTDGHDHQGHDHGDHDSDTAAIDTDHGDHDHSSMSTSSSGSHNHAADDQSHAAVMSLVDPANATHVAATDGNWSDRATWGGNIPGTGAYVTIPTGVIVTVDTKLDPEIERIGVEGTLRFATNVDTELKVDTLVTMPSGTLEIGTPEQPIADDVVASIEFADDGPIDRAQDPSLISRGALLHGKTVVQGGEVTHRTTVTTYPRAGDTSIQVNGPLVGWDAGDEIVITGTNGATSDERRVITAVDGSTVRFAEPLQRDHVPPANDLDLYVANLTRNVQFSSENPQIDRRGHLMVMHTLDAQIRGAQFTDMGRTDKSRELTDVEFDEIEPGAVGWNGQFELLGGDNVRGRYTVHFHRGGADPRSTPGVVADSVVIGDPGWAFTNHSSHVDFLRNVAYDNAGAGFFTEAGDETGRWIDNIAIRTVMPNFTFGDEGAIDPDLRANRQDFGIDGDGFWLQGNRMDLIGNVSAGSTAHGIIWWSESLAEADLGRVAMVDVATLPDPSLVPDRDQIEVWWAPLGEVRDNVAYGSTVGFRARYIHGASYLNDPNVPPMAYIESLTPTIDGMVTWDVRDGVLMNYNERLNLKNIRAIGNAVPFKHNFGHTAAIGVGLDLNNDATFGPGSIENVDLRNFEVGFLAPRHGLWTVRNVTTAATTDVLIHNPLHTERSLEMESFTFAPLNGTDLAGREGSRRNVVLAYDANGDGDGVDPTTAEDGPTGEPQKADRVTWDGLGLYSPASIDLPADARTDARVTNGLVGTPAPVPTMTHVPGEGAMDEGDEGGDDEDRDDEDGEDDDRNEDGQSGDADDERDDADDERSDEDDDDRDDEDGDDRDQEGDLREFDSVEQLIEQTLADLRGVLASADQETIDELVEWCGSDEFEADDPFGLICIAQSTDGETSPIAEAAEDDAFDTIDRIIESALERLEEDETALDDLLERCESTDADDRDGDAIWSMICTIFTAEGDDDDRDDRDEDDDE
ncbi:MAG: G8 domain-containing protein [Actinomycetota bacterium]